MNTNTTNQPISNLGIGFWELGIGVGLPAGKAGIWIIDLH
jgi:hypothetical protein